MQVTIYRYTQTVYHCISIVQTIAIPIVTIIQLCYNQVTQLGIYHQDSHFSVLSTQCHVEINFLATYVVKIHIVKLHVIYCLHFYKHGALTFTTYLPNCIAYRLCTYIATVYMYICTHTLHVYFCT